jgi:hypothetical protein
MDEGRAGGGLGQGKTCAGSLIPCRFDIVIQEQNGHFDQSGVRSRQ